MGVPPDDVSDGYDQGERLVRVEVGLGLLSQQTTRLEAATSARADQLSAQMDRLERTVNGRPSWAAASLLTASAALNGALGSALVALIVARR